MKTDKNKTIVHSEFTLDAENKMVSANNSALKLTDREYSLLAALFSKPNHIYSRVDILEDIWSVDPLSSLSNVIDVHIKNLRKKLAVLSSTPVIHTVRGVGYCAKA